MSFLEELLKRFRRPEPRMYTPMQETLRYTDTPYPSNYGANPIFNELQRKYQFMNHMDKSSRPDMSSTDREYLANLMKHIPQPLLMKFLQDRMDKDLNTSLLGLAAAPDQVNLKERNYLENPQQQWNTVTDPRQEDLLYHRGILPRVM
jgi:hypothetical protein